MRRYDDLRLGLLDAGQCFVPAVTRLGRMVVGQPQVHVHAEDDEAAEHRLEAGQPAVRAVRVWPGDLDAGRVHRQELALELVRHVDLARSVVPQQRRPVRQFGVLGLLDAPHRVLGGEHVAVGELADDGLGAEVELRLAVADVDRGQLLAGRLDQLHQLLGVVILELRIDQHDLAFAHDQRRRDREDAGRARVVNLKLNLAPLRIEVSGGIFFHSLRPPVECHVSILTCQPKVHELRRRKLFQMLTFAE